MEHKQSIADELSEIAPTLAIMDKPVNPELPVGYFNTFQKRLSTDIQISTFPKPQNPAIPDFYFLAFREKLMGQIRAASIQKELDTFAPTLAAVKTSPQIQSALEKKTQREVILRSIRQSTQKQSNSFLAEVDHVFAQLLGLLFAPKYHLAWSGAISAVALIFLLQIKPAVTQPCNTLACLSQQEIEQYIRSNSDEFDEQMLESAPLPVLQDDFNQLELNEKEQNEYLREAFDQTEIL